MHARYGLEYRARQASGAAMLHLIAVNADPVHLASAQDFFLADGRNIVFGLARNRAGIAADAGIKIDRHAPFVILVFPFRIE